MIGESSKQGVKGAQCYRCHDYGHVAAQCMPRDLFVKGDDLDGNEFEEEIYEPAGSASDTDENVRVSSIQLSIARCLHAASRDEDWCRSCMFYTYVAHEGKSYKSMIDGRSVSILSPRQLWRGWVSKLNPTHNHTTLIGLTKLLNLLSNIV